MGFIRNRSVLGFFLLPAVISLAGCDGADDVSDDEAEFRQSSAAEGTDLPWNDPDIEIHMGPTTDDPDCLVWDIKQGKVHDGPADEGRVLMLIEGDDIMDPEGNVLCRREGNTLTETTRIRSAETDEVLFTVYRRWVFAGHLDLSGLTPWQKFLKLKNSLLYTFHVDQVFDGPFLADEVLVTATENVQLASRTRKLLITALLEEECGGNGLPHSY